MSRDDILTEVERQLRLWQDGGPRPSVRSVAAAVGVSRQAIYRSHRLAVERLRVSTIDASQQQKVALKMDLLREQVRRERSKVAMLTTLCGELAVELSDTREMLVQERARAERFRRRAGADG